MEWQDIKTAPKDGTKILLSCPARRGEYPGVVEKCYWHVWGHASGKWWDWVCPDKPTHWMPLPSPPEGNVRREK